MEINFTENQESEPLFKNVENNQFFVSRGGHLCQKINEEKYIAIADSNGYPCAYFSQIVYQNEQIKIERILPKVTKINF